MESFWPKLPIIIPNAEGTQMWWDIFWWIFQIVIMTVMVIILTKWALKMDEQKEGNAPSEDAVENQSSS